MKVLTLQIIIVSLILDGYEIVISKNLDYILKCSSLFVPLFDTFLKLIVLFQFRMKINLWLFCEVYFLYTSRCSKLLIQKVVRV